jgi:hypothetical protein
MPRYIEAAEWYIQAVELLQPTLQRHPSYPSYMLVVHVPSYHGQRETILFLWLLRET